MHLHVLWRFLFYSGLWTGSIGDIYAQETKDPFAPLYNEISESYVLKVKPIFIEKCLDCHSQETRYPWYHVIPGIGYMMDQHIRDGLKDIEFRDTFPFGGKKKPYKQLASIKRHIEKGDMPPKSYRWLHPKARFSDEEKKIVFEWADFYTNKMKALNKE